MSYPAIDPNAIPEPKQSSPLDALHPDFVSIRLQPGDLHPTGFCLVLFHRLPELHDRLTAEQCYQGKYVVIDYARANEMQCLVGSDGVTALAPKWITPKSFNPDEAVRLTRMLRQSEIENQIRRDPGLALKHIQNALESAKK